MNIMELKFPQRLLTYLIFGAAWGLLFTWFFTKAANADYIFGFWQDSAIFGGVGAVLYGAAFEIFRMLTYKKVDAIRKDIAQNAAIIFDAFAVCILEQKPFEGWLFLTSDNLIFKTVSKKRVREFTVLMDQVDFEKFNKVFKILVSGVPYFQVGQKWADALKVALNMPDPVQPQEQD